MHLIIRKLVLALSPMAAALALSGCGGGDGREDKALQTTVPAAPVVPQVVAGLEDATLQGVLSTKDLPAGNYAFELTAPPEHGTVQVDRITGAFSYTPHPDYFGTDAFNYRITKTTRHPVHGRVLIDIANVNDAPTLAAIDDMMNSAETRDTALPIEVIDVDGDATQLSAVAIDPSIATVVLDDADRSIVISPVSRGSTTIKISATDGTLNSEEEFEFTVGRVVRTARVTTPAPSRSVIIVTNTYDTTVDVGLAWNGRKIYETREEMATDAMATAGIDQQSRALALWQFVRDNTYHGLPLADSTWENDPLLLINSIGWGYCDDVAGALVHLARAGGLESRVWALNGHVAPEIKVNGAWQLLDPDLAVYYKNDLGTITGVEELQLRPDLITNPIDPLYLPASSYYGYQPFIAVIYGSASDNAVWLDDEIGVPDVSGTFALPPNAKLKFPAIWTETVSDSGGFQPTVYASVKLILPAGFSGTFRLPLVAKEITGAGRLRVMGRDFDIGSDSLNEFLQRYWIFAPEIEVFSSSEPTEIVMLVNPKGASLREDNEVKLKSQFSWALQVEAEQLPDHIRSLDESKIPPPPVEWEFQ
jgi:hypothetical protein